MIRGKDDEMMTTRYAQPSQANRTSPRIVARDFEAKIQPVKRYMQSTYEM